MRRTSPNCSSPSSRNDSRCLHALPRRPPQGRLVVVLQIPDGSSRLTVVALPGGVHDGRVRLTEQHGIASTPDMAAICLLAEGNLAA